MTSVANTKGKIVEGTITGIVGSIFTLLTQHILVWTTQLNVIQTVMLGCAAGAGAGAGVLEILARRRSQVVTATSPATADSEVQALPIPVHHDEDGSDPSVQFWHSIDERVKYGRNVRSLISKSRRRVIISGIELKYVVMFCSHELKTALSSGVLVGIVISKATPKNIALYARYSSGIDKSIDATHDFYNALADSLDKRQQECFALYHTDIPLTHSIGLYDDAVYVSEFCIDRVSSVCPSFSPPPGSKTHDQFISELRALLKESQCKRGSGHARLLGSLS